VEVPRLSRRIAKKIVKCQADSSSREQRRIPANSTLDFITFFIWLGIPGQLP
jgi:hypothetical protein